MFLSDGLAPPSREGTEGLTHQERLAKTEVSAGYTLSPRPQQIPTEFPLLVTLDGAGPDLVAGCQVSAEPFPISQ